MSRFYEKQRHSIAEAKLWLSLAYRKVETPHLPLDHGLDALATRPRAGPPLHSLNPIKLEQ